MAAKPTPIRPETDPTLDRVIKIIGNESVTEIAKRTYVGASTLRNWKAGKVRRPLNYTIDATLDAMGYERVIRKRKG